MRVNVEDDLFDSGRLARLALDLRWNEDKALGRLVKFYRRTQHAKIVSGTLDEIYKAAGIEFRSKSQLENFLRSMTFAGLAVAIENVETQYTINGNAKHVERIEHLQRTAQAGGKARASQKASHMATQKGSQTSALLTPYSLLLTDKNKKEDQILAKTKKAEKKPDGRVAAFAAVWFEEFSKANKGAKPAWGEREGRTVKNLLGSRSLDRLTELARKFFEWPNPQVIEAGWPFCEGPWSFQLQISKLEADLVNWDRRHKANEIRQHEREALDRAHFTAQSKRITAAINAEQKLITEPEVRRVLG